MDVTTIAYPPDSVKDAWPTRNVHFCTGTAFIYDEGLDAAARLNDGEYSAASSLTSPILESLTELQRRRQMSNTAVDEFAKHAMKLLGYCDRIWNGYSQDKESAIIRNRDGFNRLPYSVLAASGDVLLPVHITANVLFAGTYVLVVRQGMVVAVVREQLPEGLPRVNW